MDKPTLDELMDDILSVVSEPEREECEFTSDELLERSKTSATAEVFRNMLDRKVAAGVLSKRWALVNGKRKIVYRKVE